MRSDWNTSTLMTPSPAKPKEETSVALDFFRYDSHIDLLNAFVIRKQSEDKKAWSLGSWAKRLKLSSSAALVNVLKGRKLPSEDLGLRFAESMKMRPLEAEYFVTLLELARQKGSVGSVQLGLRRKLKALSTLATTDFLSVDRFSFVSRPHHFIIREMVNLRDYREDCQWISKRMKYSVSPETVRESIQNLIHAGLLERTRDGKLKMTSPFQDTTRDVPSEALKLYHEQCAEMAKQAIRTTPVAERDFSNNVLSVRMSRMQEMKDFIKAFREEFSGCFDSADGSADEVYHLNIQLFPVSQKDEEKAHA